jgi:hypothetical protein
MNKISNTTKAAAAIVTIISFFLLVVLIVDTCTGQEIIHAPVEVINTTPKNTTRLYPDHWKSHGLPSNHYRIMYNGYYYAIEFRISNYFERVYPTDYSEAIFKKKEDAIKLAWSHYYKTGKRHQEIYEENRLKDAPYSILEDTIKPINSVISVMHAKTYQWDSVNHKLIEIKP